MGEILKQIATFIKEVGVNVALNLFLLGVIFGLIPSILTAQHDSIYATAKQNQAILIGIFNTEQATCLNRSTTPDERDLCQTAYKQTITLLKVAGLTLE